MNSQSRKDNGEGNSSISIKQWIDEGIKTKMQRQMETVKALSKQEVGRNDPT
jgi:hypothetical protein